MTSTRPGGRKAVMELRRLYCLRAIFHQRFLPDTVQPPRPTGEIDLEVGIGTEEPGEDRPWFGVEVVVRLTPDLEQHQPYEVDVSYKGEFDLSPEFASMDDPWTLARKMGAAILFPYVRETVSSLTTRGTSGSVLIPTFNVAGFVDEAEQQPEAQATANTETGHPNSGE